MQYYGINDFILISLDMYELFGPVKEEIEALKYKKDYLIEQIDEIKLENFKELLVFERMKQTGTNVQPTLVVLKQLKQLENDQIYIGHNRKIMEYELSIAKKEKAVSIYKNKRLSTFQWKSFNLQMYVEMAQNLAKTQSNDDLKKILQMIFSNELNDKSLYYDIRWGRLYHIYDLIIKKAPQEYKSLFRTIFEITKRFDGEIIINWLNYIEDPITIDNIKSACLYMYEEEKKMDGVI